MGLREHLQSAIREQAKAGVVSKDLTYMIGNKKEWHHTKEGILRKGATTYDYQGEGGLFTFDGEHLNQAGTNEFVKLLSEQLQKFKGIWVHKEHSEDEETVADKMHKHKKHNKLDVVDTEDVDIEVVDEPEKPDNTEKSKNSEKNSEKTPTPTAQPTAKTKLGKKLKKVSFFGYLSHVLFGDSGEDGYIEQPVEPSKMDLSVKPASDAEDSQLRKDEEKGEGKDDKTLDRNDDKDKDMDKDKDKDKDKEKEKE